MTKEEKIKEAWGEYFANLSDKTKQYILLNNGQVNIYLLPKEDKDMLLEDNDIRRYDSDFICTKTDEGTKFMFKPKSLQGIEDNNGWSVIPSIHDKEIEKGQYWVVYPNEFIEVAYYDGTMECYKFWRLNFTHYQPIQKPEPPIY